MEEILRSPLEGQVVYAIIFKVLYVQTVVGLGIKWAEDTTIAIVQSCSVQARYFSKGGTFWGE